MGNERITIKITVKDRWCDNDEYDQYGELIRWPNPDPTVVWNSGCWDKELGQGVMMEISASKFRELTGHIIYGGNVEARGVHKVSILFGDYTRLKTYRAEGVVLRRTRKKSRATKPVRVLPERARESRIEKIMKGEAIAKKGAQVRVRRKAK